MNYPELSYNTRRSYLSVTQIIMALVISAAFFLFSLSAFKSYKSEIEVILIPKSDVVSRQVGSVLANMQRLPGMLAFYEKIIAENKNLPDLFAGKQPDEKKRLWNQMISVKKDDGSSIIKIAIYSKNRLKSQEFAKITALTLAETLGYYYNIKTDAEVRIVEEVITATAVKNWPLFAVISLIFGFAVSFIIDSIIYKLSNKLFFRKKRFVAEKEIPPVFPEMKKPKMPERQQAWMRQAGAPPNLPVDDSVLPMEEKIIENKAKNDDKFINYEPTEEELKRRLNQLLRGDL